MNPHKKYIFKLFKNLIILNKNYLFKMCDNCIIRGKFA